MKERRKIIKHVMSEKEVEIDIYLCNNCQEILNPRGFFNDIGNYQQLSDHICTACGEGHFCRTCMLLVQDGEKCYGDSYEPFYIRLCPSCQTKYSYELHCIKDWEKEIEEFENNISNSKELLYNKGGKNEK